ncbi:MAG TPA: hypothetical protein VGB75_04805 [Jatrophihabitans sp.]|uniref:hypothetical protein n=1 Tax=Jatrophihabitans sp. TaxID=1932789 RepID=UPI002F0EBA0A
MVQPPYGGIPPVSPYYRAMAPKPGCIPLRPLDVGEVLGGAVEAIRRNARTVLGLSAVAAVAQALIGLFVQRYANLQGGRAIDQSDPANPQVYWGQLGKVLASTLGLSLLSSVFAAVLTGMIVVVVTEDVVGRKASLELVWSKVRSRIWRLVTLSLLVGVLAAVGLVLCLAPGIWLWGIWAVAVPALIIENRGIGQALRRSQNLVRGTFWRVWGIRALGFGITLALGGVLSAVAGATAAAITGDRPAGLLGAGAGSLSWTYLLISAIGTALAVTLTAPFQASIDSLLYVDLRMRKEQLAVDLQQAAAGVQQPPRHYG